ncbi:MAG: hypothetical protein O7G84_12810 [Gammaproteobacteria bacterium]|nr:hypothetical protein [Gammaproteobacteria bacterium]
MNWVARLAMGILAVGCTAAAADHHAPGLFDSNDLLTVTLTGPFKDVVRDRDPEPLEHDMTLTVGGHELAVKVRPRGNFRRCGAGGVAHCKPEICKFPPIKLNFKKKAVAGTPFAGEDKLKLVTHCQDRDSYEQNVFKEYLAYRVLNLFTDESFRVRLMHIAYEDTAGKVSTTRYAFVLEDSKAMAKRVGAKYVKPEEVERGQLAQPAATRVAMFQYFISNTDYSLIRGRAGDTCCHNVKLIQREPDVFIPVPYDYDMSGIVSTSYSYPDGGLAQKHRLSSVRDRLYRGFCTDRGTLDSVLGEFQEKREAIYALINETGLMSSSSVSRTTKFFDGFYKMLDKDSRVERAFVKGCRG